MASAPIALHKEKTQVTAASPSVTKRKRTIHDSNSDLQQPARKTIKNELIERSSCITIDLCEDEHENKDERETSGAQNVIRQQDFHPAMPPVLIDLEDPFKEEDEENTVAPQMMLSSNGNSATDMNLITFPATSAVNVSPTLRIGVWASNDLRGGA